MKTTKDKLLPIYKYFFNAILENGCFPEAWLSGTIHPIYKGKGSPKDPSNYRPITILSCLGKLFTAILNNRLNIFLEDNAILMQNQAGFRKDYSCSDHIFTLNCLMQALKKRKRKLFCHFIDFSKAFDKVWRNGLWYKLLSCNIKCKISKVIYNMYQSIKSCVSVNSQTSSFFPYEKWC